MKRAALEIALLAAACFGAKAAAAADLPGAEAPDFVLKSVSGENLRLSEYRGEVVVLSFWASWCGRCREQLEELGVLEARYRDAGLRLLSVSLDPERSRAADAALAAAIGYPVLHDANGLVGEMYQIDALPSVVLIDRYGVVRDVFEGVTQGADAAYLDRLRALLRE